MDTTSVFYALLRAGLWERDTSLPTSAPVDFNALFDLAKEQNLVGLVTAGIEHLQDHHLSYDDKHLFIHHTLTLEKRNKAMCHLVSILVGKMQQAGIFTIVVKGQGVAQYYERPLWRASSDIDFFFDEENYEKAKVFLSPHATRVLPEEEELLHTAMCFGPWAVELHGLMPTLLSNQINSTVYRLQQEMFRNRSVRLWHHDGVDIPLPQPDDDIILVFTHFLKHFFVGGVGIRQLLDWCRILWKCQDAIDLQLLHSRLSRMGILSEWRAMATFAVQYLGMPPEAMPFYQPTARQRRLAYRISRILLNRGDLGQNNEIYRIRRSKQPGGNLVTLLRRIREFQQIFFVFPLDTPRFFINYMSIKLKKARGKEVGALK